MMQLFVIVFSFSSYLLASNLNYLQLNALRQQHNFINHDRGYTELFINSSKRFYDLYHVTDEDDLDKLNNEVNNAYKAPYKTHLALEQIVKYKNVLFKLSAQNTLIAEVNNPVFPEASLFNIRTDGFWLQNENQYQGINIISNLSYLNRWYLHRDYSLKDIITEETDIKLQGGKTYNPIYLDLQLSKTVRNERFQLEFIGIDLLNNDRHDYFESEITYLKNFERTTYGFAITPIYVGDYLIEDTFSFLINYEFDNNLKLNTKFSRIDKSIMLSYQFNRLVINSGYEMINRTAISEDYIENFFLRLQLLY